ncbi:hypothetical protein [Foetidibacter luteolus]|uniref:hypothetical protein n=1 Tax=Foetidibacter luteolus TaxID=2608880 RepID=UPI00129BBDBC|nr:hypothetical protein [Foetidibacter luteolus]
MKHYKPLVLPAILFCFCCCHYTGSITRYTNKSNALPQPYFAGFRLLKIPTDNIALGAQWKENIEASIPFADTTGMAEVQQLSDRSFNDAQTFNSSLKLNMLDLLGLNNNGDAARLTINHAVITRAGTVNDLANYQGGTYIWEGLMIKSFYLVTSTAKVNTVRNRLQAHNSNASTLVTNERTGNSKILVTNFNRYIAYKLVRFANLTTYLYDDLKVEEAEGLKGNQQRRYIKGFTIGQQYTGRITRLADYIKNNYTDSKDFIAEQQRRSVWPLKSTGDDCVSVLEIDCNNKTGSGTTSKVKMLLGCPLFPESAASRPAFTTYIIPLSSGQENNRIIREELEVTQMVFDAERQYPDVAPRGAVRQFTHRKSILPVIEIKE